MLNKFHKLLIIFMMVFIGACSDSNTGGSQDQDGGTITPPDIGTPDPSTPKWDGTTFTEIIPKGNVYEIYNANHLAWVAKKSFSDDYNFSEKTIKFMNDIDMDNKPFRGIILFAGNMDGNGKKISNLNISHNRNHTGLIGELETNGTIKNLTIASGTIDGYRFVGAFVGNAIGTNLLIDNCVNHANVSGNDHTGGYVGRLFTDATITIKHSINFGNIKGTHAVGGIIGYGAGESLTIDNSSNHGTIEGNDIGGIGGYVNSTTLVLTNSYNTGTVIPTLKGGGLIGWVAGYHETGATISNTHNYALDMKDITGALVGTTDSIALKINNSYWLKTGVDISAIGDRGQPIDGSTFSELTAAQFKNTNHASFIDWDFVNTWEILPEGLYPTLKKKQ